MKKFLIQLIKVYQKAVSPFLGNNCRYYPSCSQYSIQAIEKYGVLKGILKSIWRILRCNPFSKGGVDNP
jgi:putative membrane protein insertion efficiency factor